MLIVKALLIGIIGGILIRGIFAILHLRQHSLDSPIGYVAIKAPLNYMTTYEILSQSAGRRWTRYLLFRTIPVAVSFILVAGLSQRAEPSDQMLRVLPFIILIITFYIPDLVLMVINRANPDYTSVLLLKVLLFFLNLLIGAIVFVATLFIDFTSVIPSFDGIKDNLWSTLLVAVIVAWFIQFTDMNPETSRSDSRIAEREKYIKQQGEVISEKYREAIDQASQKNNVDYRIMEALLVYENINRPKFIRDVENILVSVLPVSLTVGIAQVSSERRLSDEESIGKMGEILGKTVAMLDDSLETHDWLLKLLESYNDKKYAQNVVEILDILYPGYSNKKDLF
ncbi:MAG: hypothetical protein LKJ44_01405 [Bifidobacteriaceae bacterium]|nr:hypothetical protein [Bifidobacteriaceae bacterium]